MRRFFVTRIKILPALAAFLCIGCSSEVKALLIDQGIGFLSTISAAAATSLINQLFGSTA